MRNHRLQGGDSAALLTPQEMARADALAMADGRSRLALMEEAGRAVARRAVALAGEGRIAVLVGSGNNGGDGFVAARLLQEMGREVAVFALVPPEHFKGDAAEAAKRWRNVRPLAEFGEEGFSLVIDALFGAGLSRQPTGQAAVAIDRLNASRIPVLAVDLPSGVSGLDGRRFEPYVDATETITFFRRKPGHLLMPGRESCGRVEVAEIGIESSVLEEIRPRTFANEPALWLNELQRPAAAGHKYDRGHAAIFSGPAAKTGAARLSAVAALRGGAGLVTVLSPGSAILVHAAHLTAVMLSRCDDVDELTRILGDARLNAFVLGPGFGTGERARSFALAVLDAGRRLVLDADGISSFADDPDALFEAAGQGHGRMVLTPHEGEFKRLFPDLAAGTAPGKVERARKAAERSGAVVVLKGADTVIAAPDGRAAINANGTSWLATAGTGDVLSGIVCAQLAQGTPAFEAACASVWMHARAAEHFGPGLIAEDLPGMLPKVHADLSGIEHA